MKSASNRQFLRLCKRALLSAAFIGISAGPALAQLTPAQQQAVDRQTGIASPDRDAGRLFDEDFVPRVTPRVEVRELQIQGAPAGAEEIMFELGGIRLDGVTAYPEAALRAVYDGRIGTSISLAELYVIAAEITRKYRNDGYILTQVVVPPQTIEGGIASLQVVEGTIGEIEVRDAAEGSATRLIRDYAAQIKSQGPMNTKDLERALLLINDLPGVDARSVLNPSPTQTGAADLVILIDRKPYDGQIGIDNFGTRFLGPVQLSGAVSVNSQLGFNERITVQAAVSPDQDRYHELLFGSISYEVPVWNRGTTLELLAAHTDTDPGFTLDQFDVQGWATTLSAEVRHPFIRTRALNLYGHMKFDYREITTRNNIPVDPTRKDHIRALRAGGQLETIDNLLGVAYNIFDLEFSKGLDILGANSKRQLDKSRPAAGPDFYKMNAEIQRLQRVTSGINLLLAGTGQLSNGPLLSAEEFGLGGTNYGRGYDPSEVIGDEGLAGKIEIQWNEPYKFSDIEGYQLYSFYDIGRIWNEDATTRGNIKETLTSAGVGIRADFSAVTNAGFLLAFPLNNTPQTDTNRDPRVLVNLNHRF